MDKAVPCLTEDIHFFCTVNSGNDAQHNFYLFCEPAETDILFSYLF